MSRVNASEPDLCSGSSQLYISVSADDLKSWEANRINQMADVPNIALRAYELWDAAGRPEGRSVEFYFQAEEEFRKLLEIERPRECHDDSIKLLAAETE